jgi:hypothetical protein
MSAQLHNDSSNIQNNDVFIFSWGYLPVYDKNRTVDAENRSMLGNLQKTAASKVFEAAAAGLFTFKELIDIEPVFVRTEPIFHLPSAGIELLLLLASTGQTAFDRKGPRVIL